MNELMRPYQRLEVTKDNIENSYTRTLTKNTKRTYTAYIKDFFCVINLSDISVDMINSVTVDTANTFIQDLKRKGLSNSTINLKVSALKNFYSFLTRRDVKIAEYNPFDTKEGCKRLKTQKDFSRTYCATEDDASKMLAVCTEDTIVSIREKIIVTLFITTGIRREEMANIKVGDITTHRDTYLILIHGKGNKERYCVLPDDLFPVIEKYLEMRGIGWKDKDQYLLVSHAPNYIETKLSLVSIHNIIKKIAKLAKVDYTKISCHSMRRFYATESYEMGTSIEDLKDQMGHTKTETTQAYLYHTKIINTSKTNKIMEKLKGQGN